MEKEAEVEKQITKNRRVIFLAQALLMAGAAGATQKYVDGEFGLGVTVFAWLMLLHTYLPRN